MTTYYAVLADNFGHERTISFKVRREPSFEGRTHIAHRKKAWAHSAILGDRPFYFCWMKRDYYEQTA